jgi:alkylhydroperoxidase/carboxymuconolactone decarboxylase family protein YurZ
MLKEIIKDPETIPLDDKEKAMLFFVLKIVKNSNSIQQNDMDMLHQLGWEDKEILEATYHGTSQVAADMMFNAFKIDLEK